MCLRKAFHQKHPALLSYRQGPRNTVEAGGNQGQASQRRTLGPRVPALPPGPSSLRRFPQEAMREGSRSSSSPTVHFTDGETEASGRGRTHTQDCPDVWGNGASAEALLGAGHPPPSLPRGGPTSKNSCSVLRLQGEGHRLALVPEAMGGGQ